MSNTLYIKHRPQILDEIVGQDELVSVLKNSAKTGNISHAYLFSGGRGTGKTTAARAFAKELDIHRDDILELDAASNNGVEEIKAITESVYTLPFFSKYKMYILDEAHMLTKAASNAFLKTLEEPPKHCIFILCTTDPEKLLDTILSRCTKFNLKSPNQNILSKFLEKICDKENIKVGERGNYDISREAINLIALSGDGSYRDSLSNLQKVLSFTNEKYTEEFVAKVLGMPQVSAIFTYLKSLDGILDLQEGIQVLRKLETQCVDVNLLSREITYFARLLLLARHQLITPKEIESEFGAHITEFITEFLQNKQPKFNSKTLSQILSAEISARNSSLPLLAYQIILFQ